MYDHSNRTCLFSCLLVFCTGLIVAGVLVLLSCSDGSREALVREYDRFAVQWDEMTLHQFRNASFSVSLRNTSYIALRVDEEPDELEDHNSDLEQYSPLKYTWRGQLSALQPHSASASAWNTASYLLTFNSTDTGSGETVEWEVGPAPLMYEDRVTANAKVCNHQYGGNYENERGYCTVYYVLLSICVKVSCNDASGWAADSSGGGVGCDPADDWSPFVYERVHGDRSAAGTSFRRSPPSEGSDGDVTVEVRHSKDPFIEARNLTKDSMYFGTTRGVKIAGGLELLICGLVLMVPAWCYFGDRHRAGREAHREKYGHVVDYSMPVQPMQSPIGRDREMQPVAAAI